jgi:hypothetical protein
MPTVERYPGVVQTISTSELASSGGRGSPAMLNDRGVDPAAQGNVRGQDGALHARHRLESRQELALEGDDLLIRVLLGRQIEAGDEHVRRVCEAGRHIEKPGQGADHQSRADHQHERQRDLGDDQRRAQPAPRSGRHRAVLQGIDEIRLRDLQRRHHTGDHAGEERNPERESEHRRIEPHFVEPRDGLRRKRDQGIDAPRRQEHAQNAPAQRQQHRLGQELPHHARPPASQRRADGQLALPGRAAREEHARDIGAGDEEHHDHRAEQRLEDRLDGSDQVVEERRRPQGHALVLCKPRRDDAAFPFEIAIGLGEGCARLEPADGDRPMRVAFVEVLLRVREGHQRLRSVQERQPERRRHHADDRVHPPVERDALAEDVRVPAEVALPEAVRDDRRMGSAVVVLLAGESAAEGGIHFDGREEAGTDLRGREHHRTAAVGHGEPRRIDLGDGLEGLVLAGEVEVVGVRPGTGPGVFEHLVEPHQPVRLRHRQGLEDDVLQHAEDGARPADAECEGQGGGRAERRCSPKGADCVAQLADEALHDCRPIARDALPGSAAR